LAIKRPAIGLKPNQLGKILGHQALKKIAKDSPINMDDII